MAELHRDGDELVLGLSSFEKVEAFHDDIRTPMSSVRSIEVVDDVVHAVYGFKFPGPRWPAKLAVGTFISCSGTRMFAVVHRDQLRGVIVKLSDARFDEIIIGSDDPEGIKARIEAS